MKPYALETLETPTRPAPLLSMPTIIGVVARYMCIDPADIGRSTRHPRVVRARELVVHFGRKHTILSYPKMAETMGRPNHSSLITMRDRFLQEMDDIRAKQVADVERILEPLFPPQEGEYAS